MSEPAALDPVDATGGGPDSPGGSAPPGAPVRRRLPITMYVLAGLILTKAVLIGLVVIGATYEPVLFIARSGSGSGRPAGSRG